MIVRSVGSLAAAPGAAYRVASEDWIVRNRRSITSRTEQTFGRFAT